MIAYRFEADLVDEAHGCAHAKGPVDVGRPRFEALRAVLECRLAFPYRIDHFPSQKEGFHLLHDRPFDVKGADAHRAVHLVSGQGCEIDVERRQVEGEMPCALGAVGDENAAVGVDARGEFLQGEDGAEHIGDVRAGEDLGARAYLIEFAFGKAPVFVQGKIDQRGSGEVADALPYDEVAVVLAAGQGYLVLGPHVVERVAHGHEIQPFGGVSGEDDLVVSHAKEVGQLKARLLVLGGRDDAIAIRPAIGVGIRFPVVALDRLEYASGALGGCGAVEVMERKAPFGAFRVVSEPGECGTVFHLISLAVERLPRHPSGRGTQARCSVC